METWIKPTNLPSKFQNHPKCTPQSKSIPCNSHVFFVIYCKSKYRPPGQFERERQKIGTLSPRSLVLKKWSVSAACLLYWSANPTDFKPTPCIMTWWWSQNIPKLWGFFCDTVLPAADCSTLHFNCNAFQTWATTCSCAGSPK